MSLPHIPNITPEISLNQCETINLLLSSIALEEIGLSHILNAEGEKLQYFLKKKPHHVKDLITINDNVNKTLKNIVKSQMMLMMKLEDVVELAQQLPCYKQSSCNRIKNDCQCKKSDCCHCHFKCPNCHQISSED